MSLPTQQHNHRLYDYFLICGLDFTSGLEPDNLSRDVQCSPLERSYKCRVLEHFPASLPDNPFDRNAVGMLSLPNGLQFRTQKNLVDPKFHSFVITREDGSRYYGFSLVFFEEVKNAKISNAMQDLQAMHLTELSSAGKSPLHNSRSLPRHFKLTAHHPRAAQNYYDSSKDTLYVSKSIGLICQSPYMVVAQAFLSHLHKYAMTKPGGANQLSVESYVYNFLYEVPIPRPGRSFEIDILGAAKMIVQRPITIEELPLLDYSLETLFSLLTIDHIMQLYTCILLENQVLISSGDYQKLMLVAECMCSLLFPFAWQHVYVPILPASLQHFLDAPVPFIMGLSAQDSHNSIGSEAELCYLNIDTGVMQIPEERPAFPRRREFSRKLEELLDKFGVRFTSDTSHQTDIMSQSIVLSGGYPDPPKRKHSWSHNSDEVKIPLITEQDNHTVTSGPDETSPFTTSTEKDPIEQYLSLLTFNNAIRETFLNNFAFIFSDYHKFVIMPKEEDRDEWFKNRETMANFDKATFLSDQPEHDLPFLSQFLESQMFASFIDSKIMSQNHELDHNLRVFDKRIKALSRRNVSDVDACQVSVKESQRLIEKRFSDVSEVVPSVKEILAAPSEHFRLKKTPKSFPSLESSVLSKEPSRRYRNGNTSIQWPTHRRTRRDHTHGDRNGQPPRPTVAHSPARIAQANWNFVETLLKDCKSKTNRMVLVKMSAEGVQLGEQLGHVEENTLIASFCDHLEKVWSHGIQNKQGKSALWSHLVRFKEETSEIEVPSHVIDPSISVSPDLSSVAQDLDLSSRSSEPSPCHTPDSRSLERRSGPSKLSEYPSLKPLPVSLTFDIRNIEAMTEIKSEIGFSRAWIRLSLEKKLLSKHLQSLLSDTNLLKAQYKRNAFLRCEEEREQFIFHLLSLNAVNYHCFTNTYLSAKLPYRVMIVPVKRTHVSSTTANAWIAVSGTHCETSQIPIPKGSIDFVFHHKNLGLLTTLRIGHDNTGIAPNWFVDAVIVRCEVTAHTYRFPCGHYLGRRLEDGSSERLLVGERVKTPKAEGGEVFIPTPRSPVPTRRLPQRSVAELQHMIGDAVNNVVKLFHRGEARSRGALTALTPLLCGEMGLVESLQHAFLYGFKASRFFGRNLYLWDYFLRIKENYENSSRARDFGSLDRTSNRFNNNNNNDGGCENQRPYTLNRRESDGSGWRGASDGQIPRANRTASCERQPNYYSLSRGREGSSSARRRMARGDRSQDAILSFCVLVGKIENSARSYGKDGKFQQFICLALREHVLHRFIHPISATRATLEMYEEHSFVRNMSLRSFLVDILESLSEYDFTLEASITSGID